MNTAVSETSRDDARTPNRKLIVAYLKYAVKDVNELDETSGRLLQLAIAYLEGRSADRQAADGQALSLQ
jgi:hypothetical protein